MLGNSIQKENLNKFDQFYEIRLARHSDIPIIMNYIDKHWKKGHIMSKDKEFFYHEYVQGENVNFLLAFHRELGTLEAIYGFIPSCRHDITKGIVWGSIWKANAKSYNLPFLGIELARRLDDLFPSGRFVGIGANKKTAVPVRKKIFKNFVAPMKHYYLLNHDKNFFQLAQVNDYYVTTLDYEENKSFRLELIKNDQELDIKFDYKRYFSESYKDDSYIKHRYFNHLIVV